MKGQLSRADILAALCAHGQDHADFVARGAGFRSLSRPIAKPVEVASVEPGPGDAADWDTRLPEPHEASRWAPIPFWRAVGVTHLRPQAQPDESPVPAVESEVPVLEQLPGPLDPDAEPAEFEPLSRWSRLEPMLHAAFTKRGCEGSIDIPALVDEAARRRLPRQIPRRPREPWNRELVVIVDRSPRLMPYWRDQTELCRRLRAVLGAGRVREIGMPDGIGGGWRYGFDSVDTAWFSGASSVLALSDLGSLGDGLERQHWRTLGEQLAQFAVTAVALLPCARDRLGRSQTQHWQTLEWEASGISTDSGEDLQSRRRAQVETLLDACSPCVRVELGFVRSLRRRVFGPGSDAGIESDLFEHVDVAARSHRTIALSSEAADRRLPHFRPTRAQAVAWLKALYGHRAHMPAELWHEELTRGAPALASELPAEFAAKFGQAEDFLVSALARARRGDEGDPLGPALQSWLLRVGHRAPETLWTHETVGTELYRAWGEARRRHRELRLPARATFERYDELHDEVSTERETEWLLVQHGDELLAVPGVRTSSAVGAYAGGSDSTCWSPIIAISVRRPRLRVRSCRGTAWQEIELHRSEAVHVCELVAAEAFAIVSDCQRVEVEMMTQPTWACAAGRDLFGLWADVELNGFVQRFRWLAPGSFVRGWMEEGQVEQRTENVELSRGFWLGETLVTQELWVSVMETNPSERRDPKRPVERVSWHDTQAFCSRVTEVHGIHFRLPTRAEWQFASWSATSADPAQYRFVGILAMIEDLEHPERNPKFHEQSADGFARASALNDMAGMEWLWCSDWLGPFETDRSLDPQGPSEGQLRVVCSGIVGPHRMALILNSPHGFDPESRRDDTGFRLVIRERNPAEAAAIVDDEGEHQDISRGGERSWPTLVCEENGEQLHADEHNRFVLIGTTDTVSIHQLEGHTWCLARGESLELLDIGSAFAFEGLSWRLLTRTKKMPAGTRLADVSFEIRVSRDRTRIEIDVVRVGAGYVRLNQRGYSDLFVLLAQARLSARVPEDAEAGWVPAKAVRDTVGYHSDRLLGDAIQRIRRRIRNAGIADSRDIIERREGAGEVRMGTARIKLSTIEDDR